MEKLLLMVMSEAIYLRQNSGLLWQGRSVGSAHEETPLFDYGCGVGWVRES